MGMVQILWLYHEIITLKEGLWYLSCMIKIKKKNLKEDCCALFVIIWYPIPYGEHTMHKNTFTVSYTCKVQSKKHLIFTKVNTICLFDQNKKWTCMMGTVSLTSKLYCEYYPRMTYYHQQWRLYRVVFLFCFVFVVAGLNPALHRPRDAIHHGSVHLQHPLHLQTYFEMGSVLKCWPQICDPLEFSGIIGVNPSSPLHG